MLLSSADPSRPFTPEYRAYRRAWMKQDRAKHPERHKEARRNSYRKRTPAGMCSQCGTRPRGDVFSTCAPCRVRKRAYDRRRKTGATAEWWAATLAAQGQVCALCGGPGEGKGLAVDHDHATGALRAILCGSCNGGLGLFRDNPDVLERAAAYVRQHKALAALKGAH